jgi:hypothetical protein
MAYSSVYYDVNYRSGTLTIIIDGRRYYLNMNAQAPGKFVSHFQHNGRTVDVSFSQGTPHEKPLVTVFTTLKGGEGQPEYVYTNVWVADKNLSYGNAEDYFNRRNNSSVATIVAWLIVLFAMGVYLYSKL